MLHNQPPWTIHQQVQSMFDFPLLWLVQYFSHRDGEANILFVQPVPPPPPNPPPKNSQKLLFIDLLLLWGRELGMELNPSLVGMNSILILHSIKI